MHEGGLLRQDGDQHRGRGGCCAGARGAGAGAAWRRRLDPTSPVMSSTVRLAAASLNALRTTSKSLPCQKPRRALLLYRPPGKAWSSTVVGGGPRVGLPLAPILHGPSTLLAGGTIRQKRARSLVSPIVRLDG